MTPPTLARAAVLAAAVFLTGCGAADEPADVAQPTVADGTSGAAAASTSAATGVTTESTPLDPDRVVDYTIEVTATHPHDPGAFTQGLEVVGGHLLESTGQRGESSIRLVEPSSGEPIRSVPLDDELFGEGATVVGDEVWQLTWTSETLLIHDLQNLTELRRLPYQGEGWGLCATADALVMSDGSSVLTLRDRISFEVVGAVQVLDDGEPLGRLNELECVDGLVWANVYQTTRLVAIDPVTGRVVGRADVAELVPDGFEDDANNVANGIASDPATGRFYLTGKRWPVLYEVELVPAS